MFRCSVDFKASTERNGIHIMRKTLCLLTAIVMLCAMFTIAQAEGGALFYAEAPASASVGDTLTVKVCLSGEYNANVLTMWLHYDSSAFKYLSHTDGEVLNAANASGNFALSQAAEDKSFIAIGVMGIMDEGFSAQGVIIEAKFQVLSGASSSNEFRVEVGEFGLMPIGAPEATPIAFETRSVRVSVSGGGSSPSVTNPPSPSIIPGQRTEAADNTPAPGSTEAVPGSTEAVPGSTEAAPDSGDKPERTIPALEPSNADIDVTGKEIDGKDLEDKKTDPDITAKTGKELSTLAKAGIIAGAVLAAAGFGFLGVHFVKKGKQAHEEAAANRRHSSK